MQPKATIIIPVYNGESTIRQAVDSAVNQDTKEPYEVLIIDDGSKDSSGKIIDEYAEKYDYVHVVHQKNQGICRTRENALRLAQGDYIYWVDADDYADAKLLSATLPNLEDGADMVIFSTRYFLQNGEVKLDKIRNPAKKRDGWYRDALDSHLATVWTYAARKKLWGAIKIPHELQRSGEDGYMTIHALQRASRVDAVSDILYFHLVDSFLSLRHTVSGMVYLGNAFLWLYRLKICEKDWSGKVNFCAVRAFSGYVKAFCMNTLSHDLSEEDCQQIRKELSYLKKYPVGHRVKDWLLCWAILSDNIWICQKYADYKNNKTARINHKISSAKK